MDRARPTILILTTDTGGGHLNLAQSLRDMVGTDYSVVIVNPQSPAVERGYTVASRHCTQFLTWQFMLTNNYVASFLQHRVMAPFSLGRLRGIIERVRPQLILVTHALLSYVAARARDDGCKQIPLAFQLTDLEYLHATWFEEKRADAYLAPTREIFEQAVQRGIDARRLYLTGRPVRRQFLDASAERRSAVLTSLGLDPAALTVFLQGGAKGSAAIDRTIGALQGTDVQIILAAGNNRAMLERYTGVEQVRALPFMEEIAPYMAAADIIAGKAGASFITEAFMLEKPFLVTTLIAGQETPNLAFIRRHNLGWICLGTPAQRELLTAIASNPAMLAGKVQYVRAYKDYNLQANRALRPLIAQLVNQ